MAKQLSMEEEVWDKKRVVIGVGILVLLIVGFVFGKNDFFPQQNVPLVKQMKVKGAQTEKSFSSLSLPSVSDITEKIQKIQDQVTHVNIGDIASSSPQIQQIMQEIQNLPNLPKSVAKQACETLCSKL